MVIIAVFPGQGSQSPGFLAPWLEREGAAQRLQQYSDWAGVDLVAAGTEWDADRIRDTQVAQPLIVAASLLSWNALEDRENVVGVAGHSVGEFAAAAAAGILSEEDALRLVGLRGRAMAEAAGAQESGMSAVIGGDEATVVARLEELGLTPANYNGGGQLVAAGALDALQALAAEPSPGTRVIPLAVAGAFHTDFMAPAVETLRQAAAAVEPARPGAADLDQPRRLHGRRAVPRTAICSLSRSPRRCAGICAWPRSPRRASAASSNSPPPERSSAWPSEPCAACLRSPSRPRTTSSPRAHF